MINYYAIGIFSSVNNGNRKRYKIDMYDLGLIRD